LCVKLVFSIISASAPSVIITPTRTPVYPRIEIEVCAVVTSKNADATPIQHVDLPKIVIPNFGDAPTGAQPIPTAEEVRIATEGYRRLWLVLNLGSISLTPLRKAAVPLIWSTVLEEFEVSKQEQNVFDFDFGAEMTWQ
jgi:hypothetical protein